VTTLDVDVVVPVYNAPDDLRRCVASVLARTPALARLVLIDDGSTDSGVAAYFDELRARGDSRIELLRNDRNLGFTATANRGFAHSHRDVVLLNSDTIVTRGWLDALVACAASDPRIATVTPFSNNAEICSFPRFCEVNPVPDDPDRIADALRRAAVPMYPDLPTGVGFCMFVRRAALDAIGVFDLAFGAGYGEENDFCLRAAHAGWRNVLADDAFVVHSGGRSFEGRKAELGARNLALLTARYPHYEPMVRDFIAADPLRPIRDAACAILGVERTASNATNVARAQCVDPAQPSPDVWQRLARRAFAIRRTPVGRLLYRVTPEPVIDALKARFDR
jgi:GT2 family glycosyltransferase